MIHATRNTLERFRGEPETPMVGLAICACGADLARLSNGDLNVRSVFRPSETLGAERLSAIDCPHCLVLLDEALLNPKTPNGEPTR